MAIGQQLLNKELKALSCNCDGTSMLKVEKHIQKGLAKVVDIFNH